MARILFALLASLVAFSSAFVVPAASSVVTAPAARSSVEMFGGSNKAAPKKVAAKKPVAKKVSGPKGKSPKGKGGILPWVTNTPGTYAEPIMLSAVDFLGADGDKWIGWGAMPDSVKKLYNRNGRKGLL